MISRSHDDRQGRPGERSSAPAAGRPDSATPSHASPALVERALILDREREEVVALSNHLPVALRDRREHIGQAADRRPPELVGVVVDDPVGAGARSLRAAPSGSPGDSGDADAPRPAEPWPIHGPRTPRRISGVASVEPWSVAIDEIDALRQVVVQICLEHRPARRWTSRVMTSFIPAETTGSSREPSVDQRPCHRSVGLGPSQHRVIAVCR